MIFNTKHPDVRFRWRNIAAEYLGTLLLVYISTNTFVAWTTFEKSQRFLVYGLTQGLTLSVLVHIFISISGAHFNPAITISTVITRYVGLLEGSLYIISQILGAVSGSALTILSQPYGHLQEHGSLGACFPIASQTFPKVTPIGMGRAFIIEFMTTLLLCLTYFGSFYKSKHLSNETGLDSITKLFSHISIGFVMIIGTFTGLPTGGCMNPARAFASELISMSWNINSWIYYIAPLLGSLVGAIVYEFILTKPKKSYVQIK